MFRSMLCVLLLGLASFAALADGPVRAAEVSASDGRAVRAVIGAQLKALGGARPADAFNYATPAIRQRFGDAASFAEMVRSRYPMLIRPAAIGFSRPQAAPGAIVQGVQLRDRDGQAWRAVYELQREPGRGWRINGCVVEPDDASAST